jgi:hypothetical protein
MLKTYITLYFFSDKQESYIIALKEESSNTHNKCHDKDMCRIKEREKCSNKFNVIMSKQSVKIKFSNQ